MKLYKYLIIPAAVLTSACGTEKHLTLPAAIATPAMHAAGGDSLRTDNLRNVFHDAKLQALIDTLLANNFDLLAATQRIQTARAQLMLAKNASLPSLDVSVRAGVERYGDYTLNGVGNFDTNLSPNIDKDRRIPGPTPDYFAGLRSSWEADIWGKLRTRKRAAYERMLAAEEGRQLLKTQLVAAVTGMYYELAALDTELEIIRRNITLQESAVATVNIQKAGGRATELAVQQFSAQLLSTQALEFSVKQEIAALEFQLNAVLGRLPQNIQRREFPKDSLVLPALQGIMASQLLARPDIRQAEKELAAAKLDGCGSRAESLFPVAYHFALCWIQCL
ncbi:TolC family protein [Chitinophaga horti]|uniref:TolC family protein n=1 Tax=Chitinophaga horti TaxID=2920382 RepID=A0ABY6J9F1_9BACT|nr:TolC family protein [Chitinophaga horti]UYQ95212.1 TolC family protein [Chitinophaga horti]